MGLGRPMRPWRIDARRVEPREERYSRRVGRIQTRDFAGMSAGLSNHYRASSTLTLGSTLMRTFRAPGIEELFSEGPHLAAYSYEVGNGALDSERGLGLELFADYHREKGHVHLAVFRNAIDGYIFPKNSWRAQSAARRSLSLPNRGRARPHARCRSYLRLASGGALEGGR